jgi:hypothetical protein
MRLSTVCLSTVLEEEDTCGCRYLRYVYLQYIYRVRESVLFIGTQFSILYSLSTVHLQYIYRVLLSTVHLSTVLENENTCVCRYREMMLFIGTRFSNLYTAVHTPA